MYAWDPADVDGALSVTATDCEINSKALICFRKVQQGLQADISDVPKQVIDCTSIACHWQSFAHCLIASFSCVAIMLTCCSSPFDLSVKIVFISSMAATFPATEESLSLLN